MSVNEILRQVFDVFGAHPDETEPERWTIEVNNFCDALNSVAIGQAQCAANLLGQGLLDELTVNSTYLVEPGGLVCESFLKHEPNCELALSWTLYPHVRSRNQQAFVTMGLHIGYEWLEPWCWLSERWWRVLEVLLIPLGFEFRDNGTKWLPGQPRKPEFRGKHLLRKVLNYLDRAQNSDDVTFSFEADFFGDQSEEEIQLRSTVLFAVYDAVRQLKAGRAEPDLLLNHYLRLKSALPRHSWRAKTDLPWRVPPAVLREESES